MSGSKCCSMFWCFLVVMSGLALLGMGIWMAVDDKVYDSKIMQNPDLLDNKTPWNGSLGGIMIVGIYNFLVGILGMAGTGCDLDKKIRNSLIAFAVFASIGVIAMIICASITSYKFATTDELETKADAKNDLVNLYENQTEENDFVQAWDRYQLEYQCCGVYNFTDYGNSKFTNQTTEPVPWTCCTVEDSMDPLDATGPHDLKDYDMCLSQAEGNSSLNEYLNTNGCGNNHWDNFRQYQVIVLSISWTSVFVEIVALFVTGCLRTSASKYFA